MRAHNEKVNVERELYHDAYSDCDTDRDADSDRESDDVYYSSYSDSEDEKELSLDDHVFTTKVLLRENDQEVAVHVYVQKQLNSGKVYIKLAENQLTLGKLSYGQSINGVALHVFSLKSKFDQTYKHIGSLLIEAAFKISLELNLKGRLELDSAYGSWYFYKNGLNFSCAPQVSDNLKKQMNEFEEQHKGKRINQDDANVAVKSQLIAMYLTPTEIENKKQKYGLFFSTNQSNKRIDEKIDDAALEKLINSHSII